MKWVVKIFQFPRAVFLKSAPDTAKLFKKFWVFVYLKKLYPMVMFVCAWVASFSSCEHLKGDSSQVFIF